MSKRIIKFSFMIFFIFLALVVLATVVFMQQPLFGKHPSGARLERIKKSPHYRDGQFQNESFTPDLAEGNSYLKVIRAH
jgi:hypothetical protein